MYCRCAGETLQEIDLAESEERRVGQGRHRKAMWLQLRPQLNLWETESWDALGQAVLDYICLSQSLAAFHPERECDLGEGSPYSWGKFLVRSAAGK